MKYCFRLGILLSSIDSGISMKYCFRLGILPSVIVPERGHLE